MPSQNPGMARGVVSTISIDTVRAPSPRPGEQRPTKKPQTHRRRTVAAVMVSNSVFAKSGTETTSPGTAGGSGTTAEFAWAGFVLEEERSDIARESGFIEDELLQHELALLGR